jgi:hypothetical protein
MTEEPKPERKNSDEDPPQEVQAAETEREIEARKRAIESEQNEIVVFPEEN